MSGESWSRSVGRLLGGVKKLKIDDQDSSTPSRLGDAFPNHWNAISSTSGSSGVTANAKVPITICSDINCTEDRIACGLSNGDIVLVDTTRPTLSISVGSVGKGKRKKGGSSSSVPPTSRRHRGLTSIVCSKTRPELVYSAGAKDGTVNLWDFRESGGDMMPSHTFSVGSSRIGGEAESTPRVRPLLCLDISPGDQVVCAGTELVGEDSFILFWDVRMAASGTGSGNQTGDKLLGAYWESHSDDVTAVRFHPEKFNSLATGSTDGLLNVFDLLQPSEDDALLYSFNTESSVESVQWSVHSSSAALPPSCLTCVTHCNQVQLWDTDSGDKFANFDRTEIAQAMMRSNPEAAFVNRCYRLKVGQDNSTSCSLGLMTCSLKGSCTRFISIDGKKLEPSGLFLNQNPIVQTAEYVSKSNKWITFDDEGSVRVWSVENKADTDSGEQTSTKRRKKDVEEVEEKSVSEKNDLFNAKKRKSNKIKNKDCLF